MDQSADVLAYLRESLFRSGYDVLTNNSLRDSLILLRATRPGSTILGPNRASPATEQAFRSASASSPLLELGDEFSTLTPARPQRNSWKNQRLTQPGPAQPLP